MRSLFKWATALTFAITFAAPTFAGTWSWSLTGSGVSASGVLTTLGDATSFEAVTGISGAFNGNAINGLVPLNSDARFIYNNLFAFNGATPAIDGFGLLIDVAVLGHLNLLDRNRIGLYGLSWGGKVAMRVPALEPRYALSICSGDFNEWIWKNATTAWRNSYMFAPEPDIFDFNLGMTFGHAEMAAMIAPRPFMVERGHDDGVGIDEMVALEYARVRRLYDKLKIGRQTEIEYFNGIHQINGVGTFDFLQRHFNFPPTAPKL